MPDELEIRTIADLERILVENPRIREKIRRKLLTDEERDLPRVVAQLAEQLQKLTQTVAEGFAQVAEQFAIVNRRLSQLEGGQSQILDRQDRLEKRQSRLEESQRRMEEGQRRLAGLVLEQTVARRQLPRISQEMKLRRTRILMSLDRPMPEELEDTLYDAATRGDISIDQADAVTWTDIIISGISIENQTPTYILAEVFSTLNRGDIIRAKERAETLGKATGQKTLAATASSIIPGPQRSQAEREGVATFLIEHDWQSTVSTTPEYRSTRLGDFE